MEQNLPLLQEHQAPASSSGSNNPAGYTPTAEEKKTIALVEKLYQRAKKGRRLYDEKWLDFYKMFRGKQWKETRPSYRHSEVINMIFQTIQSQVPILVDSRPRIEFIPQNPLDREVANILNDVAESDWQSNNWLYQLTEMCLDGHIYGTGMGEMLYDAKAKLGLGSIRFSSFDPFYFYPQPSALDINEAKTQYVVTAVPTDVDQLKLDYPDKAKFIKPDLTDVAQGNKTNLDQVRFRSPVDAKTTLEGTSAYDIESKDQALKITLWMKSDEFIEEQVKELDPNTNEETTKFVQKLKYPNGRKIVKVNGVLCEDSENPFEDGKFPYEKFNNYILPREFWGMSEIEQLEGPQKIFNKVISFMLDVFTLMGNPIWVVDTNAGIDTDNLFNRPGLVLEPEPGTRVERVQGLEINQTLFELADRVRSWFNEISGSSDVTRGIEPQDITAASAINSLQEAAQTRIRQKSRNLDCTLQNLGQLYQARVLQFYTSPRIFRLTGDQEADKYFKFHIETKTDDQGNEVKVANIRNYSQDPLTGEYKQDLDSKQLIINDQLDVRVSTGSSLPFAKAEKLNKSVTLFKLGVIDDEELLKNIDYPNYEAVLDRMRQKKEAEAQAKAQAQGGAPPPGGGGGPPSSPPPPA